MSGNTSSSQAQSTAWAQYALHCDTHEAKQLLATALCVVSKVKGDSELSCAFENRRFRFDVSELESVSAAVQQLDVVNLAGCQLPATITLFERELVAEAQPRVFMVLQVTPDKIQLDIDTQVISEDRVEIMLRLIEVELSSDSERTHYALNLQQSLFSATTGSQLTTITQQFIAIVAQFPSRVAIEDDEGRVTYQQLYTEVLSVAQHLAENTTLGGRVAVILKRSRRSVIALLAINYIGAVYVPIEVQHPEHYIREQLSLVDAQVVLYDDEHAFYGTLPQALNLRRLSLHPSKVISPSTRGFDHEFAILFTSGSTGKSKAVVHAERSFLERFNWQWRVSPITHEDVIGQRTNLGFGPHIWECLGAILKGAKLVILQDDVVAEPIKLAAHIEKFGITRLALVPSLAKLLLDSDDIKARCRTMRVCSLAGEGFDAQLVNALRAAFSGCDVFNDFGSTECNCLFFHLLTEGRVALGKPSDAAHVQIMSSNGKPCLPFQPGMLHVAGSTLALGYLDADGALQALPMSEFGYATGDRVFYDAEGLLYPLGRQNNIVKVRGMRVDLVSVEAQLRSLLPCHELSLVARTKSDGETQLVAFYVDEQWSPLDLLRQCRPLLPAHYCPAYFKQVTQLPKLANGKLDKVTLVKQLTLSAEPHVNDVTEALIQIVSQLTELPLSVAELHGYTLSELGIDSLALVKLARIVEQRFGKVYSVAELANLEQLLDLVKLIKGEPIQLSKSQLHSDLDLLLSAAASAETTIAAAGSAILLTGASGFVGAFLLAELLREHKVYCPVRADSDDEARARVIRNLAQYGLAERVNGNLYAFRADISKPQFAISLSAYTQLITQVSTVYHLAADVNHIQSYPALRSDLLQTWKNFIPFLRKQSTQFHFFSSIAVCRLKQGNWTKQAVFHHGEEIVSGYGQSKWLGEQFLTACRASASTFIYRIGEIGGERHSGKGRSNDFVHNLLAVMASLGVYPSSLRGKALVVDMLPVDWLVQFILCCAQSRDNQIQLFNLQAPVAQPLHEVLALLGCQEEQTLSWQQWLAAIHRKVQLHTTQLLNVLPFYTEPHSPQWLEYFTHLTMECDLQHSATSAAQSSAWISHASWSAYAANWRQQGLNFNNN
ncbi:AMP-binding protein [Pseudoalteromonas fenneropenaei]|uniref:AMP-binding protein n=1 Tax=Pseudoalteromonas fenneropenaei TaxID=1737459 RepID=A0ABV7CNX4_9GAMM